LAMLGLNVLALMIYRLTGHFGLFHALALLSLATLAVSVVPVLLRRPRRYWLELHYFAIGLTYAGLVAGFGNELLARVPFLHQIVFTGPLNAAALARIFQVGNVLSTAITVLAIALLAWRYRAVMAQLGRGPRGDFAPST